MIYTDGSRFTDEDKELVDNVANVVAYVCGITVEELRSNSRKRNCTDPRKLFCNFIINNLKIKGFTVTLAGKHIRTHSSLAILSWYLNQDHSTIMYASSVADVLYKTNKEFRFKFDSVIKILNNPKKVIDEYKESLYKLTKLTWEGVKYDDDVPYMMRVQLMPKSVSHMINNLFMNGYSISMIASRVKVSLTLVDKYALNSGLVAKRNRMRKSNDVLYSSVSRVSKFESCG